MAVMMRKLKLINFCMILNQESLLMAAFQASIRVLVSESPMMSEDLAALIQLKDLVALMILRDPADHRILPDLVDLTTLVDLSALTAPRDLVAPMILRDPVDLLAP